MIGKNHRNEFGPVPGTDFWLGSLPDQLPTIAEPKQVEIDSSDSVLTRADLAWMTDEVVMLKGKWLLGLDGWSMVHRIGCLSDELRGSLVKGAQDWNDFEEGRSLVLQGRDENLFEVEFRNDLMDSPPAMTGPMTGCGCGCGNLLRVVRVRVRVKLMRAMAMVVIDQY
ncbi:hypothetical protein PPACK8108_LOCUS2326 [Phakopsora pachyrhizi]|uniref:Uncharacterized protein n=1 Tax=Phakopsora pachyrhizi TaxID=170000 RepID=A0AAV0AJ73_PHAPC|nr:hypothetical protein PPACK8108_LOCUS2326 [Phakopsora pachyrhizi]